MILLYIDESGTGLKDRQSPYFVLSALAVPSQNSREIDAQVISLKRQLVSWAKPEDFEIKGRDLRRGDKLFRGLDWEQRSQAIVAVARLIAESDGQILVVQVDTRDLPEYIATDSDLYRLAFWRLLDKIDELLREVDQPGMLLLDARSDLHSSVQDRRIVDSFRDWLGTRANQTRLAEIPWFGFSAFYSGLQLADFIAYLVDFVANESNRPKRENPMQEAYALIAQKTHLFRIP